jgi:hypothetical protein
VAEGRASRGVLSQDVSGRLSGIVSALRSLHPMHCMGHRLYDIH